MVPTATCHKHGIGVLLAEMEPWILQRVPPTVWQTPALKSLMDQLHGVPESFLLPGQEL